MRWKKYFTPPFTDTGVYINDALGRRIAHWAIDFQSSQQWIDKMNGVSMTKAKFPIIYHDDKIGLVAPNGRFVPVMVMRCSGYLPDGPESIYIQDEFAEYIVEQLNK